ncbi:MAG: glucose-1-phosphate cytidylyltransferase [Rhodothermales bacterium]|nr:glucose-1-phosphate cytidylyltransferase [Rhodothermales bacterium]MBO6779566.1 glucose-1-phosphate cytidylyltransferase [Rhodothermales bacterium]
MKVVLFCGGMGTRMRSYSESIPKPMVPVGYRPILWHLMKYYAAHGHKDFILCLGWQADVIKRYFRDYDETVSNDFVMQPGGEVEVLGGDIHDWKITFVDTGIRANIGERLMAVRDHLRGEPMFLANYADGLSDADVTAMVAEARATGNVATFAGVKPTQSFHVVTDDGSSQVRQIMPVTQAGLRINGGFFVLRQEIFDYMEPGEEMVIEPFHRLIREDRLGVYKHDGFWACMDTFKEKKLLDDLFELGNAPWTRLWDTADQRVGQERQAPRDSAGTSRLLPTTPSAQRLERAPDRAPVRARRKQITLRRETDS